MKSLFNGRAVWHDLFLLPLFLLGTAYLTGCHENPTGPDEPGVPNVTLPDLEGNTFQLSSTQGQVVLLHFFGPWCPVCQAEQPELNALYEQFKDDGLTIVGIGVQTVKDSLVAFKNRYEVPYTILVDNNGAARTQFGVNSVPRTFVITRDVRFANPPGGYPALSEEQWTQVVEPLLAE